MSTGKISSVFLSLPVGQIELKRYKMVQSDLKIIQHIKKTIHS